MCVYFCEKAGQNIILRPCSASLPVGWLGEFTPEGTELLRTRYPVFNCAGLLRRRGETDAPTRVTSDGGAHPRAADAPRNNSPVAQFLRRTAAAACFVLSKQRRFAGGRRSKAIRSVPAILFVLQSLHYYQGAEWQTGKQPGLAFTDRSGTRDGEWSVSDFPI